MFHKSARGRVVNFDELAHKNAKTIAVGNANLNAKGDVIGRGGAVVQYAEDRDKSSTVISSTSKASIQSEVASLKAARNQWTETTETVQESETTFESELSLDGSTASKKKRNITESE